MKRSHALVSVVVLALAVAACGSPPPAPEPTEPGVSGEANVLEDHREVRLRNVRQLTFGGENAEAYWSEDGTRLIFQSSRDGLACDQIFIMNADGSDVHMVSTGEGKTTCAYWFPDRQRILYASTHLASPDCPPPPDYSKGYVWKLENTFDIFTANADGGDLRRLTDNPGYDAEATISTDGSKIIFTSLRNGDLDLYVMDPDGSNVTRITDAVGYDGGAFYSRDGEKIVWRASRPETEEEKAAYRELLEAGAIRPMNLEIWVSDADGGNAVQVTDNGAANFGPYFFPDGERVIFSSNMGDPGGRNFDLWMVKADGTGLERVTFNETFDGFPMFSPDGRHLVFASNRNNAAEGDTNLFVAEWVDEPEAAGASR